ncbi:MAG: protealysin inhibitor emfourin [Cyanobacteriota bacterium]
MRIVFERTGGFAAMKMTKEIDTATLPAEETNQLRQLVDAADFFHLPTTITPKTPQPDRFGYRITIQESDHQHTVVTSEQALPGTLRPLIDWLMAAVRQR